MLAYASDSNGANVDSNDVDATELESDGKVDGALRL
jgi:hypothetical protein